MREDLDLKLCQDFPLLYADRNGDKANTCMYWGIAVGAGWEPLIRRLSEKLEAAIQAMPEEEREQYRAAQVKQKFGGLRFYMTTATDEMNEWISDAEDESTRTCEVCGELGKITGKGWLKALCPEHAK